MTDLDSDFLPLRVIRTCSDGKHRYDPKGKRKLIEACRRPGASLAGLARRADINANQLRKWVLLHERKLAAQTYEAPCVSSAFVPVVPIDKATNASNPAATTAPALESGERLEPCDAPSQRVSPARLTARLPNGIVLGLECSGRDASLVTAMTAALGAR